MPKVEAALKNPFFNYFKIDGDEAKHRILRQVWNDSGTSIVIQGPSWDGQGINGFGKRHLLATEKGSFAGNAEGKARSIVTKRMGGVGSGSRAQEFNRMVQTLTPRPDNMRDENVRQKYGEKLNRTREGLARGYASNAYGPNTSVCTFVLLDGLTQQEAAKYFGDALRAANMVEGDTKDVDITFPDDRVLQVEHNSNTTRWHTINVSVKLHKGLYHVYHCNGPA